MAGWVVTTEADIRAAEYRAQLIGERIERLTAKSVPKSERGRKAYRQECDELQESAQHLLTAIRAGLSSLPA